MRAAKEKEDLCSSRRERDFFVLLAAFIPSPFRLKFERSTKCTQDHSLLVENNHKSTGARILHRHQNSKHKTTWSFSFSVKL